MRSYLRLLRIEQWLKNSLILAPLLVAYPPSNWIEHLPAILGVGFGFSLLASATYIFNDWRDLEQDRLHRVKRSRPLASGDVSVAQALSFATALAMAGVLVVLAAAGSVALLPALSYVVLTLIYSWRGKRVALLDLGFLAVFYALRVELGARALNVLIPSALWFSFWMAFLSLAAAKRVSETEQAQGSSTGRGYSAQDLGWLTPLGVALGISAFALFFSGIVGPILAGALLLLYVFARIWMRAVRGELTVDPIVFVFRDGNAALATAIAIAIAVFTQAQT